MSLVVEDGTGKADAESYVAVADVEAYAVRWGKSFAGLEAEKEAACRLSCRRLDQEFEDQFPSLRMTDTQALAWPRGWFYDRHSVYVESGVIPPALKDAQCELAIRQRAGEDLFPDTTNRMVTAETHSTEDYAKTRHYAPAAQGTNAKPLRCFPVVEDLLRRILRPRTHRRA